MVNEESVNTQGWDAITSACKTLYPEQTDPLHYGSLISWQLGGEDPLDGVSIYDAGDYYHFVTYGFSELYEKESENLEFSGMGFELTLKLKKTPNVDEQELKNVVGILQSVARYAFGSNAFFSPYEYIYTRQTTGMDKNGTSAITGFITLPSKLGTIETPNGKVEFVELLGMTDHELAPLAEKRATHEDVANLVKQYNLSNVLTDFTRSDLF